MKSAVQNRPRSNVRRAVLGALGAAALFGPSVFSGCAVNFLPPGKVNALRVISVTADKPYIEPIPASECAADPERCTVNFDMEVHDGTGEDRPINILWIGGCFNPEGDQYALCLFPAIELFNQNKDAIDAIKEGGTPQLPPGVPVGFGKKFSIVVPDIVSSRPEPQFGPHYGIGYVFFLACAGYFGVLDEDPSAAGNFPIGCFDFDTGEKLGAESFVPGYTQIYSFADGRQNQNPAVTGLTIDGEPIPEDLTQIPTIPRCDVPADERNKPASCTREDPFTACTTYEIEVEVPPDVGEIDPEAKGDDGEPLSETVWVNYLSDTGDFDGDIKLINDPTTGYQEEHKVTWIAPSEPGRTTIWAVVRDSRGGSRMVVRYVNVE
jgi:hypothetical protein